jgi:hypothetical protein
MLGRVVVGRVVVGRARGPRMPGAAQEGRKVGGAGPIRARGVGGVGGRAVVHGHAAAANAADELIAEGLQRADLLVEALTQEVGQPGRVGLRGYPLRGQGSGDLIKAETHVASGADQRQTIKRAALEAALPAQGPGGADEPDFVVVADR